MYGPKTPEEMVNESEVIKILSNLDPRHPKGPKKTKKFLSCKIVTITSSIDQTNIILEFRDLVT